MTNMIKMDLYRFFRSVSTWIILFAIAALAFLSVVLVSMNTSIQSYSNAGELLAAQINGGTLMTLCAIAVILFVSTKYKNGFIKNIANQLSRRELLVFPEIIVSSVACALYFFAYSACTVVAGAVIFKGCDCRSDIPFCRNRSAVYGHAQKGYEIVFLSKGVSVMTIKEVEEQTGLTRSNIRFYEKENLIEPTRNDKNGYRNYSESDVENIKKIAYLRTLEISIEDIRNIMSDKVSLEEIIKKQTVAIQTQIEGLNKAKSMCERMLEAGDVSFDELQVEKYVSDLETYWNDNKPVFKLDSVSFLYLWGSLITWTVIISLCLLVGILSYTNLPPEIPVQWDHGIAVSFVNKNFIFLFPVVCIIIRIWLRPVIYVKWLMNCPYGELVREYLSNYMCFAALSVEVFIILFVHGVLKSVVAVLLVDTVVLIGLLIVGIIKISSLHSLEIKK